MAGSVLSDAQIIALWLLSGGSIGSAPAALARALSESSGRTAVTSANPDGGTNVGLYQLDTLGVGSGYTVAQLQNPYLNTQITVKATGGGANWAEWADDWQAFETQAISAVASFTSSASGNLQGYAAQLTRGLTTAGAGGTGQTTAAASSGGGALASAWPGQVTGFFTDADKALGGLWAALAAFAAPSTWVRAGAGVFGAAFVTLGLVALVKAAK